jgi:hypothetical protein
MIKNLFYKKILSLLYNSDKLTHHSTISLDYLRGANAVASPTYIKTLLTLLHKELTLFRRFKLKLSLNKYKFEEKFLYKLSKLIGNFYNKKVEFNLINMKSIILNSDFFTKILSLKLINRKANIIRLMNIILNKVKFPEVNRIREKSLIIKNVNMDLIDNKYKNLNLNSILAAGQPQQKNYAVVGKSKLDNVFNNLYYNLMVEQKIPGMFTVFFKLYNVYASSMTALGIKSTREKLDEIIFNSIKYKNMGGIRLEIKGRLTKRYRADRALFKVK